MLGYKGFKSNMSCNGKQYEIGKSYHEDVAQLCEKGIHFCIDPLDIFYYYDYSYRNNNRYCLVEAENVSDEESDINSIRVCKDLKIIKEFTHKEYYKEICKYHNSKNGIIEKYNNVYIFSNNNIIYCPCDFIVYNDDRMSFHFYGNNNVLILNNNKFTYFDSFGNNNVLIRNFYPYSSCCTETFHIYQDNNMWGCF